MPNDEPKAAGLFDRFTDAVAHVWASAAWFGLCLFGVCAWLVLGVVRSLWTDDVWHLALNSPTTALTFLGVFLLHNAQHRFERLVLARLRSIEERLGIEPEEEPDR